MDNQRLILDAANMRIFEDLDFDALRINAILGNNSFIDGEVDSKFACFDLIRRGY